MKKYILTIILCLVGGIVTGKYMLCLRTELDNYYPKRYSEKNEEIMIRSFFKDRRGGFFLDVGAYHYKTASNTYYLEKNLDWSGIAIDANGEFAQGYEKNRPRTQFFNFFISNKSDTLADIFIVRDRGELTRSTAVADLVSGRKTEKVQIPTISLNDLLNKLRVEKIDFLNMDIELWEPQALAGFDIDKYKPELVCIEAHYQVREQLLPYFLDYGYVRLDQYFLFDQRNWYFTPREFYARQFDVPF